MKVLVGMSGGVDSSMAAFLLKKEGYEVEGISLILYEARGASMLKACCSAHALMDASETARQVGVRHSSLDLREEFMGLVIEPFITAYKKGLTPNPCILCNRHIKFPYLLREAEKRGAGLIATGHYAKTVRPAEAGDSSTVLKKGVDPKKDQSYVLYVLRQEELRRLILPLGHFKKEDVRAMAKECGLPASKVPESQEICFIGDMNYSDFLSGLMPDEEGPIFDMAKRPLGRHKGIYRYTVGQRKGLGISSPDPLYVARIDPEGNAIYAGPRESVFKREFRVRGLNWLIPVAGDFRASVKVRSMMKDEPAWVYREAEDSLRVVYDGPQWAPAPGQSAVFYEGDTVIGGGVISG